jgi:hypothetical protein
MRSLSQQRCFNHAVREAAARCPECKLFYCRECITEHDDRLICAACLKKLTNRSRSRHPRLFGVLRALPVGIGLGLLWIFFHLLGMTLLSIPSSFHDGTVWKPHWLEGE